MPTEDVFYVNRVVSLINKKMTEAEWSAHTPDSYTTFLFMLSDEEILEAYSEEKV